MAVGVRDLASPGEAEMQGVEATNVHAAKGRAVTGDGGLGSGGQGRGLEQPCAGRADCALQHSPTPS